MSYVRAKAVANHLPYRRAAALGQLDTISDVINVASGIVGGGGPPDGSSQDPRIIDLNNAYNSALQGNMGATGYGYLTTWIADQPPHPTYSNTYAQQLLSLLQQAGKYPGAPASAATITAMPATSTTSAAYPPTYTAAPVGVALSGTTLLLFGGLALGGLLLLRK